MTESHKETYDVLAEEYEERTGVRREFDDQVASKFTEFIDTGKKVLDLGCSVGVDASIFLSKGYDVTAVDYSENMIERARRRCPGAKFVLGDFVDIDFEEKFDAVFAQAFVHLFPKDKALDVMRKIGLLLKEGGVAQITTTKSSDSKEGWFSKVDYSGDRKRYRRHWTKEDMSESLRSAYFDVIDFYEIEDPFKKTWMVFTVKNRTRGPRA